MGIYTWSLATIPPSTSIRQRIEMFAGSRLLLVMMLLATISLSMGDDYNYDYDYETEEGGKGESTKLYAAHGRPSISKKVKHDL